MLIEPASKVSVPLTVVIRTRSSVAERVFAPAPIEFIPAVEPDKIEVKAHMLVELFNSAKVAKPSHAAVATVVVPEVKNPAVLFELFELACHAPLVYDVF